MDCYTVPESERQTMKSILTHAVSKIIKYDDPEFAFPPGMSTKVYARVQYIVSTQIMSTGFTPAVPGSSDLATPRVHSAPGRYPQ